MKKEENSSGNAANKSIESIKSKMKAQKINAEKVKGGRTFTGEPEIGGSNTTSAG